LVPGFYKNSKPVTFLAVYIPLNVNYPPLFARKVINNVEKARKNTLEQYKPRPKCVRYLLGYLALLLGTLLFRVRIKGRENIPGQGPFIVAANHFNRLDPALIVYALRRPVNFLMASDQTVEHYLMWAPWLYGFIPTNRTRLAPSTIKQAIKVLRKKEILGIFPEGVSTDNVLRPAKNGVVYLSTVTRAPILPVSVIGLENVLAKWTRGVRPVVTICFGKPFGPYALPKDRQRKEAALRQIGITVMCRIAALMPEKYHGVFSGHPKIKDYRSENRLRNVSS